MDEYEGKMRKFLTEVLGEKNWETISVESFSAPGEPMQLKQLRRALNIALHKDSTASAKFGRKIKESQIIMTLILRDQEDGSEKIPKHIVIAALPGDKRLDDAKTQEALPQGHTLQPFELPKLERAEELMGSRPGIFSPFPLNARAEDRQKMTILVHNGISLSDEWHFIPLNSTTQAAIRGRDVPKLLDHMQRDGRGPFKHLIHEHPIAL